MDNHPLSGRSVGMRERIRQVMRWSGPRMLFHHPVLAVRHLAETRKQKKGQ